MGLQFINSSLLHVFFPENIVHVEQYFNIFIQSPYLWSIPYHKTNYKVKRKKNVFLSNSIILQVPNTRCYHKDCGSLEKEEVTQFLNWRNDDLTLGLK